MNKMRLEALSEMDIHKGPHDTFEEGHCAMELVSWINGEEHSFYPNCTNPCIAGLMIGVNDGLDSDEERVRLLGPLIPLVIGTRGHENDVEMARNKWSRRIRWFHMSEGLNLRLRIQLIKRLCWIAKGRPRKTREQLLAAAGVTAK